MIRSGYQRSENLRRTCKLPGPSNYSLWEQQIDILINKLIKKSIIDININVDKNIKSSWQKYQTVIVDKNINIDKNINVDENIKVDENINLKIFFYPTCIPVAWWGASGAPGRGVKGRPSWTFNIALILSSTVLREWLASPPGPLTRLKLVKFTRMGVKHGEDNSHGSHFLSIFWTWNKIVKESFHPSLTLQVMLVTDFK